MHRRTLLAAPLILVPAIARSQPAGVQPAGVQPARPFAATLTPQDQADLARIEASLNGVKTLKSRFLQVAPDGSTSTGLAWLERPGRMRFQYDPPSPLLLVAGHGLVVFYDRQLNQTTNIPLDATPLGILLSDSISLSGPVTVTRVLRQPGQLQATLLRTASPGDGTLTLVFADDGAAVPRLRQWSVVDAQRQETRVALLDPTLGGTFDQAMFVFINPKFIPGSDKLYQ